MNVVFAPDSFKGSINAADAAAALAAGWHQVRPNDEVREIPQADGGEGTLLAVARACPEARFRDAGEVTGPDGQPLPAHWLELPDGTAVVEMAETCGLPLLSAPAPMTATSSGLGEVIAAAVDGGARSLVIALGGSASTDGGAGALRAIGTRPVPPGGAVALVDVDNPLLGPDGAAAVYAPQKGATPEQVELLEARLAALAARSEVDPSTPGSGAAGGTAYGLLSWGARLAPGAAAIAALTGLTEATTKSDLVVTGEGRFDEQSLRGKVVGSLLRTCEAAAVVAGIVAVETAHPTISLAELAGSTVAALDEPSRWLHEAGVALATRYRGVE